MTNREKLIFISYRRDDSADIAGRIYDRLVQKFGREVIFKDVDTIPFGVDFRKHLNDAVEKCSVLLAVIGRQWLNMPNEAGKRRLDNPADFVRIEIEAALERNIPVVPLLVRGASMPKPGDLPSCLENLAYRNGLPVRSDPDFHRDMDRLIAGLAAALGVRAFASGRKITPATPKKNPDILKITTPLEMELIRIPAGEFLMGSDPAKDKKTFDDELPQHRLRLLEYYIAKYPVTVVQFSAFVEQSGYQFKVKDNLKGKPNHPVVRVTWHEAIAFCEWLRQKTPHTFSLPSEAEWEKAARGTDGRIYPWGNRFDKNRCNMEESGIKTTTPAGKYSPWGDSPFGCADMAGNVWEWTRSLWGKDSETPEFKYPYDFDGERENLEVGNDVARVLRGGSFFSNTRLVRCAFRGGYGPLDRNDLMGFRVVAS